MVDGERFRGGDPRYFEELVQVHGPMVLGIARDFGEDPDHAEDLFQEVWKRAFAKRASYTTQGTFEVWLHRLATNVCIGDFRARRQRTQGLDRFANQALPEDLDSVARELLGRLERTGLHKKLRRAMAQLSEREHEAIRLRIFDEKSSREVARIMGVRQSTVRSIIRHGIRRLRRIMEANDHELPGNRPSH